MRKSHRSDLLATENFLSVLGATRNYGRLKLVDKVNGVGTSKKCEVKNIVNTINGGNNRSTWMHEDVTLSIL